MSDELAVVWSASVFYQERLEGVSDTQALGDILDLIVFLGESAFQRWRWVLVHLSGTCSIFEAFCYVLVLPRDGEAACAPQI